MLTSITLINNSNYSSLLSNIGVDMTMDQKYNISKFGKVKRKNKNDYSIGEGFGEVIRQIFSQIISL